MTKKLSRITIIFTLLTILAISISTAAALTVWDSGSVFAYNDGSTLGLTSGITATYETAANTGTTVAFTDLTVNSDPVNDWNISLSGADVTLTKFDLSTYTTYTVSALGTQNFTCPAPSYVRLDNVLVPETVGWNYDATTGTIQVIGATSTVSISFTSTPPQPEENSAFDSSTLYAALGLFTILPLVLGAAYIIKVVQTRQANTKEIVTIIALTLAVTIIAAVAIIIIYTMSSYL